MRSDPLGLGWYSMPPRTPSEMPASRGMVNATRAPNMAGAPRDRLSRSIVPTLTAPRAAVWVESSVAGELAVRPYTRSVSPFANAQSSRPLMGGTPDTELPLPEYRRGDPLKNAFQSPPVQRYVMRPTFSPMLLVPIV